jgi:hypothetical protein
VSDKVKLDFTQTKGGVLDNPIRLCLFDTGHGGGGIRCAYSARRIGKRWTVGLHTVGD